MTAYGNFVHAPVTSTPMGAGVTLDLGPISIPPGTRAHFVRSTTPQNGDDQTLVSRCFPTLNAALAQCRSGMGDFVFVLPGHTENISSADQMSNLVAGTRIIGLGRGNNRPTFTWTAATATFLLDVANVEINNCILNMDPGTGTTTVAAPITISAAGCAIRNCKIRMGTDANSLVTIGITTTAAADDLEFIGNEVYGATAAECTTMIQFVGADRLKFCDNTVVGATSAAAVGVIRFLTTASTDIKMFRNSVRNNKASSSQAITGMAGLTGEVGDLFMTVLSDNAAALTGAFSTLASLTLNGNCYVANTIAERGAAFGTVSA